MSQMPQVLVEVPEQREVLRQALADAVITATLPSRALPVRCPTDCVRSARTVWRAPAGI